jgi:site-specific DNA-methyltransferase (adenine-specific)
VTPYYQDDWVTIYHGDGREIIPTLGVRAVVTDPPYGIGYRPDGSMPESRIYEPVTGDDAPFDPAWLLALDVPLILWGANHYASSLPDRKGWLAWRKLCFYVADIEFAWTSHVSTPRFIEHEWRGATRGVEHGDHFHPTQKPLAVMRWCLAMLDPGSAPVGDPYMGSGTTLRAAKDLGMCAVGVEVEERYCEIAAQRCAQEVLAIT